MQVVTRMKIENKKIQELLKDELNNLWEKNNERRLYLDWTKLVNLEINRYNTGNISSVYLDGEKISNTKGYKYSKGNAYIDLKTNILSCTYMDIEMVCRLEHALELATGE